MSFLRANASMRDAVGRGPKRIASFQELYWNSCKHHSTIQDLWKYPSHFFLTDAGDARVGMLLIVTQCLEGLEAVRLYTVSFTLAHHIFLLHLSSRLSLESCSSLCFTDLSEGNFTRFI